MLKFWGDSGEESYFDNFEVLTCKPKPADVTTTQRQPTTTEGTLGTTTEYPTTLPGQCNNMLPIRSCFINGSERHSCNGFYKVVFENGNLVTYTTYEPIRVICSINTYYGSFACLEPNGQFVIKSPIGSVIWGSEWADSDDPSLVNPRLILEDDGSLSIVTDDGVMWSSGCGEDPPGTIPEPDPFDIPHITPPHNPRNITDLAGPCGRL